MTEEHFQVSGKMVRARLALTVAEVYGVPRARCTLGRSRGDDSQRDTCSRRHQDQDRIRRGVPTAWARHGVAQAINLGDQMLMLPTEAIDQIVGDEATNAARPCIPAFARHRRRTS